MGRQYTPLYFNQYASVRSSRVVFFERCINSQVLDARPAPPPRLGEKVDKLSYKASNRLRDAINVLVDTAKPKRLYSKDLNAYFRFRVNFITLTLPSAQVHPDKEIHNTIFKDFIRTWKRSNPSLLYVYKAEVQDCGNLHYHLSTNSFIHYKKLRKWWNRCCNLLGYVDRCSTKDPNSTDVHAIKNVKNFAGYMCAYVTKKDLYKKPLKVWHKRYDARIKALKTNVFHLPKNYFKNIKRKVEIKLWDASKMLLAKNLILNLSAGEIPRNDLEEIEAKSKKICQHDYCKVCYIDLFAVNEINCILQRYKAHLEEVSATTAKAVHITEDEPAKRKRSPRAPSAAHAPSGLVAAALFSET